MLIKNMSVDELYKVSENLNPKDYSSTFEGFAFFSRYCVNNYYNDNADFIVAFNGDEIIGILKYSIKISDGFCIHLRKEEIYTSMHYIDVKDNYKGQGVGRELVKFFNNVIDKNVSLLISEEWGEGIKVGTHKMFMKYMDNVNMILNTHYGYVNSKDGLTKSYSEFYV